MAVPACGDVPEPPVAVDAPETLRDECWWWCWWCFPDVFRGGTVIGGAGEREERSLRAEDVERAERPFAGAEASSCESSSSVAVPTMPLIDSAEEGCVRACVRAWRSIELCYGAQQGDGEERRIKLTLGRICLGWGAVIECAAAAVPWMNAG